jgi:lipopolysaccharide transport system permease protein
MPRKNGAIASKVFLLKEMVIRDVRSRYAGSGLGLLWAFAHPVLWMALYTAVFSLVLRVPAGPGYASFPEFLMAGLLPWMAVSEGIARSASCLIDNSAMVKKTVFPLETLVLSVVLAAVVNEVIAFFVYALYVALLGHLQWPWILLSVPAMQPRPKVRRI